MAVEIRLSFACLLDGTRWVGAPFFPGGVVEGEIAVAGEIEGEESK